MTKQNNDLGKLLLGNKKHHKWLNTLRLVLTERL